MIIKKLTLKNFRNYDFAELEFSDSRNLFFGENAQGKTNLLEAVFYLSCLKTFRGSRDSDVIKTGCSEASIKGIFDCYGRKIEVFCEITRTGRKLFVNGIREMRPSDHIGLIKTVSFSPDDLQLIKEGPAERRRFMNISVSQLRPGYIKALHEHNKIIENKRKILKMEEERASYLDFYDVLNEKLAKVSAYLTLERGRFLKNIEETANRVEAQISGGREELKIVYNHDSAVEDTSASSNEERIYEHLKKRKEAELASGMCLVGSHRDDFTVYINGKSARDFASQGQIRSAVLAIKVAEHEITEKDSGEKPIFLLDDVLSELDPTRRSFLLNDIGRGQTIITGCDPSMFSELSHGRIFTISGGEIANKTEN